MTQNDYAKAIINLVIGFQEDGESLDTALNKGIRFLQRLLNKRGSPKNPIIYYREFFKDNEFSNQEFEWEIKNFKRDLINHDLGKEITMNLGLYLYIQPVNNKMITHLCSPHPNPFSFGNYKGTVKVMTIIHSHETITQYVTNNVLKSIT